MRQSRVMIAGLDYLWIILAAFAAGAINALAGGGTLLSFPVLTAVGLPAVSANVTNTVALCPGYLGGIAAQARDLRGQRARVWFVLPASVIGGLAGGILLLNSGERLFRALVPYLILLASGLLALQEPLRGWLARRNARGIPVPGAAAGSATDGRANARVGEGPSASADGAHAAYAVASAGPATGSEISKVAGSRRWAALAIAAAAVYGGYFGAGLSVIVLAVLALTLDDSLTRLNALKQAVSFAVNVAAAIFFLFSGHVVWSAALVMAVGALAGGAAGGRLAGRIRPATLRTVVVVIGAVVGVIYLVRG